MAKPQAWRTVQLLNFANVLGCDFSVQGTMATVQSNGSMRILGASSKCLAELLMMVKFERIYYTQSLL